LPGIARAPLEHLGIQPPNQKSADPVDRVIDSSPPDQRNCSFGQPVAVAANVGAQGTAGGGCSRENANGDREDARSDLAGRSLGQSLWESRRSDPPPRERAFGDPPSPLAKRPDQAQQSPPATNGPDQAQQFPPATNGPDQGQQSPPATNRPEQAQQSPPATNGHDEERPPTSASQSQSGGQIAGQRSDEGQQIGQQQSLWKSRRSDPPPRERGFGDPPSPLAKRPDQAPQSPPATNRPDQAQQSPPATNGHDEERPPTSASQSQSGGQIAGQRSDEAQQIGQQQPHAAPTFSQGAVPSDPDSPQPPSSGHQIGQEQSQAAQAIVQGSSQGIQVGPPSTSVPQIGETHQAEGAGL
jgi:hypothetical protein